jgi:hypothetical protein
MGKSNVAAIDEVNNQEANLEVKSKSTKEYTKKAEKIIRRMDGVLTDVYELAVKAAELSASDTPEIAPKDNDRFKEMSEVLRSVECNLYWLTERMARKYVGKNIAPLDPGRKSLKK